MMKVFLILSFLACLIWQTEQQCHTREIDLCMAPGLLYLKSNLVPLDRRALSDACVIWKEEFRCINNYERKCLSEIHSMTLRVFMGYENEKLLDEVCQEDSKLSTDYLNAAPCLAKAIDQTLDKCLDNVEDFLYLLTGDNFTQSVEAGCCYFERFFNCYKRITDKTCAAGEHTSVIEAISKMMHFDKLHSVCRLYDPSSDMCNNVLSRKMTNPSDISSYITRLAMTYLKHLKD